MTDIVPEIKAKIMETLSELIAKDEDLADLLKALRSGEASYSDLDAYSRRLGQLTSKAFLQHVTAEALPDGQMYYNIGDRLITPLLTKDYELISENCVIVQEALNKAAGFSIKGQTAALDLDRIKGFIDRASAEPFEQIRWMFETSIQTYCQTVVSDHQIANADFHYKSGLKPKIVRTTDGHCCKWCTQMAGSYDYSPRMNRDVFRRHDNCTCKVEYDPRDGSRRRQDVWSKNWN